jgi:hypothetical protein
MDKGLRVSTHVRHEPGSWVKGGDGLSGEAGLLELLAGLGFNVVGTAAPPVSVIPAHCRGKWLKQ